MLAYANRLREDREFKRVKDGGKLFGSESFSIAVLKRGDSEPSRFGFVVSSKITPNASKRTFAKRALSEGVRVKLTELKPGYDVVYLAKPIIVKKYTSELMLEAFEALKKAGLTKNA